ncbi:hypothetical protein BN1058_02298 [Paraliobacillus sp. PM-2]|uniref:hypothetical protein n=1 Tax=Paraliobacillus sp. PM-2 TaxID=1462524 RepID=UPI00061C59F6|nr:hypothetical protein [Paraliobacillus sp. PM-2]CQR47962.1 hypothetical protein BN1058_02298 [Paraliobacillus sp. PM-2]
MHLKNYIQTIFVLCFFILLIGCELQSSPNTTTDPSSTTIESTEKVDAKVKRVVDGLSL